MEQIKITCVTCVKSDHRHVTAACITVDKASIECVRESIRATSGADRVLFNYEEVE